MKTTLKTLTLLLLMAIMLASTCITVMAAEDLPPAIEDRTARFEGYAAEAAPETDGLEGRVAEDGGEETDPKLEDRVGDGETAPYSAEPFGGIVRSRIADPDSVTGGGDTVLYNRNYAPGSSYYDDGTRMSGNTAGSLEDAPAFRDDRSSGGLETPPLTVDGDDEYGGWGETNYDDDGGYSDSDVESESHSPAPDTGAASFAGMFMAGLTLMGCAGFAARKSKAE